MNRRCDYCKQPMFVSNEEIDDFVGQNHVTYKCKNEKANVFDYENKKWVVRKCPMLNVDVKHIE